MIDRFAKAQLSPVRQRTQFSCMAASMMMCLRALGHNTNEDEVNKTMGATPTKGAAWEQALATAQHYGCRATLVCPSTVSQLKAWTDAGTPVMIAWNPEGRDWSHASTVYDVTEGLPPEIPADAIVQGDGVGTYVWVADPNIPHPEKTTRIVHEELFYTKWYEKWPRYLVRRPAMAVEREITPAGRQVMASAKRQPSAKRVASRHASVEPREAANMMRRMRKGQRVKFDKGMGHIFGGTVYEKMEDGPNGKWLMTSGQTGNLPFQWEENPDWLKSAEEIAKREAKYSFSVYQTGRFASSDPVQNFKKIVQKLSRAFKVKAHEDTRGSIARDYTLLSMGEAEAEPVYYMWVDQGEGPTLVVVGLLPDLKIAVGLYDADLGEAASSSNNIDRDTQIESYEEALRFIKS